MLAGVVAALVVTVTLSDGAVARDKIVMTYARDSIIWTPIYIARKLGYFQEQGIDLEVVPVPTGAAALTAVTTGSAQVAVGTPATTIRAREQGYKVKIIGALVNQAAYQLVVREDVAKKLNLTSATPMVERIRKLKGLTISTNGAGGAPDNTLRYVLREAGLNPDSDVTITPIPSDQAVLAVFGQKRIDGFIRSAPTTVMVIEKHKALRMIDFAKGEYKPLSGILSSAITVGEPWLEKNPDLAVRLLRALNRGLKLLKDRPAEAKAAVRSFFPNLDPTLFDYSWDGHVEIFRSGVSVQRDDIDRIIAFIKTLENKPVKGDPEQSYTNRFSDLAEQSK
jgi:NitT/TauT family transport system substrate-binding protein